MVLILKKKKNRSFISATYFRKLSVVFSTRQSNRHLLTENDFVEHGK